MAVNVTTTLLYDGGPKAPNVTWQAFGIGDGVGDIQNQVLVDVSWLSGPLTSLSILRLQFMVSFGIVQLAWDAANPTPFLNLEGFGTLDYSKQRGLINYQLSGGTRTVQVGTGNPASNPGSGNPVSPLDQSNVSTADNSATGNILITTIGFELNSEFSLYFELLKKNSVVIK